MGLLLLFRLGLLLLLALSTQPWTFTSYVRPKTNTIVRHANRESRESFGHYARAVIAAASGSEARKILADMRADGYEPKSFQYAAVIQACNRDGNWRESLAVFEELDKELGECTPECFIGALDACATGGQHGQAFRLLERLRAEKSAALDESAYTTCCRACIPSGRWMRAIEVYSLSAATNHATCAQIRISIAGSIAHDERRC